MPCSAVPRATQQGEPTNDSAIASADLPELAGIGERSRMRQRLFCAMGRRDSSALAHAGPRLTPWYPTCHLTTVHIHCSPCPTSDSSGTLPRIMRTNESIGSRSRKPRRYSATSKLYSSRPRPLRGRDRFVLLGLSSSLRTIVVCHCCREEDNVIRIISARKANRRERLIYTQRWHR